MKRKKSWWFWTKIFLILYAVVGILFYYFQETILFHPTSLATNYSFSFPRKFTETNIALSKTDTINLIQFQPTGKAKGVVLYLHGNRQNVERYVAFIDPFLKNNYEVWMPDFPGFGKSRGTLTELSMYNVGWQVLKLAETKFKSDSIIIYGKSLGTGPAAYLASINPCKLLVLETPYYSFKNAVSKYMWMYPIDRMMKIDFPTYKYLPEVKAPIAIFHGTNDGVVRYSSAAALKPFLKPADVFYSLPGATHNSVNTDPVYYKTIDSLLR